MSRNVNLTDGSLAHEILHERMRAHAKHDDAGGSMERRDWFDAAWLPVLTEEVGEVARVLCEQILGNLNDIEAVRELRSELIQVAAMTTAWITALDAT